MTDEQFAKYLGIVDHPNRQKAIAAMSQSQRATYERMAEVEHEINLWQAGLGPRPRGILIDHAKTPRRAKAVASGLRKRVLRHF